MNQIDEATYEVVKGETVTIVWTATGVSDTMIAMSVDNRELDPDPESPPTFQFTVTKRAGFEHFAGAEGSFPTGTASTAKFESMIEGSAGGVFKGPTIRQTDPPPLRVIGIAFSVVAAG